TAFIHKHEEVAMHFENQAKTWKEESRLMLLSAATRHDANIMAMTREMTLMSTEMQSIRASATTGHGSSELWAMKYTKAERDREDAERRVALLNHKLVDKGRRD
ncbi:MAG: hypothetical protein ACKPKO_27960, partial [Candidatus Fonsibacter sp.]